jgi:capsular exopolysaccharide synthesis family protein
MEYSSRHAPTTSDAADTASVLPRILRVVRKHWPVVLVCVTTGVAVSVLVTNSMRKVYTTQSLLQIDAESHSQYLGDKTRGVSDIGAESSDSSSYIQTQFKIIHSDKILGSVVNTLGLASDPDFGGRPGKPAATDTATQLLRARVRVDPILNTRLVSIAVEDFDPKRAKRIVDTITNTYIEENLQTAVSSSVDAFTWLEGQLDHVEKQLEDTENALHAFKEKNALPSTDLNETSNIIRMEMVEYTGALAKSRTQEAELAARVSEFERLEANPEHLESSELLKDTFLTNARNAYEIALNAKNELVASGKGPNHPLVKAADAHVELTRSTLLSQLKNIKGAIESDLAAVREQTASERLLYEGSKKRAVDLNMKEIEYHRLDRQRDQNEKLYQFLLERLKEADLARMMRVNNIRVIDPAPEPRTPARPILAINILVGLFGGLALGALLAWLREELDSTLKMPEDVESKLGATFLGLLPELGTDSPVTYGKARRRAKKESTPGESPELVVHKRPLSGFAEAARSIRTNLMFMNPDTPARRILVTSAAPTEGKTMIACSLAIALAQSGLRVCIVDCDLRRPRLHRVFDRVGDAGITNMLLGESSISDVAKPTVVENLWSIPAGPMPPNPADVLHSERFREIIKQLGEHFDRVIIDSPPLVAVTDGTILSKICDGTVFVVRAFKTSKFLCAQALRSLRDVDANLLGVVLNSVDLNKHEYTYNYYHYTYYKRQGYGRPEEASPAAPPN